jgi:hypothetical protein
VAEPQHRGDEDVEHRVLGVHRVVEEPRLHPEPRVVDQQVHGPVRVGQPGLDRRQ